MRWSSHLSSPGFRRLGYRLTHTIHVARRALKGSEKGSLKKMLFAFGLAWACALLWQTSAGVYADQYLQSTLYSIRGNRNAPPQVVLVGIDDYSYNALEATRMRPFPRDIFAKALKAIHDDKPKVVILDLVAQKDDEDPVANEAVREAFASGNTVSSRSVDENPFAKDPSGSDRYLEYGSDPKFQEVLAMEIQLGVPTILETVYEITLNLDPSLEDYQRVPLLAPLREFVDEKLKAPGPRDLINFYGPPGTIRRVSIAELVTESTKVPDGYFLGNTVFLGYQTIGRNRGFGDKEQFSIPVLGEQMFGVEIHATIAANLLDGSWIKRIDRKVERMLIVLLSLFLILGLLSAPPLKALMYLVGYLSVWFGATYVMFSSYHYFLPGIFLVLGSGLLILTVVAVMKNLTDRAELRDMKKMVYGGDGTTTTSTRG